MSDNVRRPYSDTQTGHGVARGFSTTSLHISTFEVEKRFGLGGLKTKRFGLSGLETYIAENITLAQPRCSLATVRMRRSILS